MQQSLHILLLSLLLRLTALVTTVEGQLQVTFASQERPGQAASVGRVLEVRASSILEGVRHQREEQDRQRGA